MKKIALYIGSMQYGGANRVIANLANHLSERGYCVLLINDVKKKENTAEYKINEKVKRFYLENKYKNRLLKNICAVTAIRKIIRQEKPYSVLSFMCEPNFRMLTATLGIKCKKVISVRNDPYVEYGDGIKKLITGMYFKLADKCVFQTQTAAGYFPKAAQKKAQILFNPVNKVFYQTARSENTGNIVTVGRLAQQKNHELLIRAFKKISATFPQENLYIYGDGALKEKTQTLINRLELANRVFLSGTTSDIASVLASAKVFALSSDYEGMPNALMEAMAIGLPVVSTNCPCGGPQSLIENGVSGFLVPCNDENALAEKLAELLKSEALRNDFSNAAKQRASEFSSEKTLKLWEQILTK